VLDRLHIASVSDSELAVQLVPSKPSESVTWISAVTAKVDLGEGNFTGLEANGELASSPDQNTAFATSTVDAAEALFLGKGQQLTGTPRCLSLQGVGLEAL